MNSMLMRYFSIVLSKFLPNYLFHFFPIFPKILEHRGKTVKTSQVEVHLSDIRLSGFQPYVLVVHVEASVSAVTLSVERVP